jgi:hypothetical protein
VPDFGIVVISIGGIHPLEQLLELHDPRPELAPSDVDVLPLDLHASHLVYHGSRHLWSHMGWLAVFVDLLRRQKDRLDGDALAREAGQDGKGVMASVTAALIGDLWPEFDGVLPAPPAKGGAPGRLVRRVHAAWGEVEPPPGRREPARVRLPRLLLGVRDTILMSDPPDRPRTALRDVGGREGCARRALALRLGWTAYREGLRAGVP